MPSSDHRFAPLGGAVRSEAFRPLGAPAPDPAAVVSSDPVAAAFEAGRAQGRVEADAALARDVERAVASIASWRAERRDRDTETLVGLVLDAARRIAGDDVDERPERWAGIVAAAIARLHGREPVTVRLAPRFAALVRAHGTGTLGRGGDVRIVEDPALADGACRVEARDGDVVEEESR
jgi:type III secretion protein L